MDPLTLTTESGETLVMETVSGITGASSLNDISVVDIEKETFDTNPTARDWVVGTDWEFDAVNLRMSHV